MRRIPLERGVWEVCRKVPRRTISAVAEGSLIAIPQDGRHGWMAFEYRKDEFKKKDIAVVVMSYPWEKGISRAIIDWDFFKALENASDVEPQYTANPDDLIIRFSRYSDGSPIIGMFRDIGVYNSSLYILSKGQGIKGWFPKTKDDKPKPEQPRRPGPIGPLQGQQRSDDAWR